MAVGHVGTYSQRGIQQQHSLTSPAREVATLWDGRSQVIFYLLEDVLQRRRKHHSFLHGEAQPMSLAWLVVGILPDDDHLYLIKGTQVESIEDQPAWRIAGSCLVLLSHLLRKLHEVGLLKLSLQLLLPRRFYLYVHRCKY